MLRAVEPSLEKGHEAMDRLRLESSFRGRAARFVRENPVTVLLMLLGIVGGAVAGAAYPMLAPEKPALLRAFGGALLGGFVSMCALGYRLFDE